VDEDGKRLSVIAGNPTEARTEYLPNTTLEHFRCGNLLGALVQRLPNDGPREKFGGPWRNLDIICNFYVYHTVSLYYSVKNQLFVCLATGQQPPPN
jgi:hypothetical protein